MNYMEVKTTIYNVVNEAIKNGIPCYILEDMIKVILTDVSNAAEIEISNLQTKENEEAKDE